MSAPAYNLRLDQGADFTISFVRKQDIGGTGTYTIINPPADTARMQVRKRVHDTAVLLDLTTANGGLTIFPAEGRIQVNITAAQTSALAVENAVYDIEIVRSGETKRLVHGAFLLSPEVTR